MYFNTYLKRHIPILFLTVLSLIVIILNFKAGTYLTGWDNLHPELDLFLNIKRSLFAVWQEYQGLGLLGGMGHAADLPRQIFLAVLSLFLPQSLLRFITTSLMLIIGPLGVYKLTQVLLPGNTEPFKKQLLSVSAGAFYLLNLATVQVFFVPFEAFVFQYGFLPWLLWTACSYFVNSQKKYLVLFMVISAISTTQSYVPTLFVVYLLALISISIGVYIKERSKKTIKKAFILFFVTICINAFWLLPFSYFTVTSSQVVGAAHENFMATEDIYLRNKEFGNIANVALLKGFWFNFVDIDTERKFTYMIGPWRQHLSIPIVMWAGYIMFGIVLLGLFNTVKKKSFFSYSLIILFFVPFTMLANETPPFSWINQIFRNIIPLFEQVFRVPFTKFAILLALSYSLLFTYGVYFLLEHIERVWRHGKTIIFIFVFSLLTLFIYPIFQGNLFYDVNQLPIPNEYFNLMNFFKTQNPNTRIANFPQYTYWGWNHYQWGYRGSGFLWYGIEQPILDRAFDGYSSYSENYYWELERATYASDNAQLGNILEKYQINWLIVDLNITSLESPKILQLNKLLTLLERLDKVKLVKRFGNIHVYKSVLKTNPKNFIFLEKGLPLIAPAYQWNNYDQAFYAYDNYISAQDKIADNAKDVYYPFRSLFTGRKQKEIEFTVLDKGSYFSFQAHIPKNLAGSTLILPQLFQEEIKEVDATFEENTLKYPQIYLDNELILVPITVNKISTSETSLPVYLPYIKTGNLEVRVPKIKGYYHFENTPSTMKLKPKSCNPFNTGIFQHDIIPDNNKSFLRLTSINSSNCITIDFPELSNRIGYLLTVDNRHIQGKSLLISLNNNTTSHSELETYLPKISKKITSYFIIPPMEQHNIGYTLHLDNISIGKEKTVNDIGNITVSQIPYRFLTSLHIEKKPDSKFISSTDTQDILVTHPNPSLYEINLSNRTMEQSSNLPRRQTGQTLVLSQAYDTGWKAYAIQKKELGIMNYATIAFPFIFGTEIKDHVKVNNWENGWNLPPYTLHPTPYTLVIIFWPQYLEYLGFLLLLVPIYWCFRSQNLTR